MTGWCNVMMKRQTSRILSRGAEFTSYTKFNNPESKLTACWSRTHLGPGYHSSKTWGTNWDPSHNAQYFNPKQRIQPSKELLQAVPHIWIAIVRSKANMI